ncbi:MAG: hypothetical protein A2808_00205 [Candidatus Moranbacteria bacterium RIFCSPHIGHO2_01_FULL_55_24]|nr:MAG: hypothetical protein A2808_00205 [Candidatus Moranbacteria bacterium RIFCSPHIGHO2_01_FULL_55_24]
MFGFSKPSYLGIDFGTSSIKAVELTEKDGAVQLLNYGQVSLAQLENGVTGSGRSYDEEVGLYLRALLEKLKPKTHSAFVAMPAFIGLISLIELPEMEEHELEEAVQFEAHRYIPSSLEDIALSWEVVGTRKATDGSGPKLEILVVAALKKEVERYRGYVMAAGLKMDFLELETFSLVRSIVGHETGLVLVIDIGSRATNLVLAENGIVRVSRNLDAGGKDVTRTLAEGLDITPDRAESLKKSGKDFLNQPESALVFPVLDMISNEAKRMLDSYKAKYPDAECRQVILSGGTAYFVGLTDYYTRQLGIPVAIGNPWQRIQHTPKQKEQIESLGTSFSVALGLALSGLDVKKEEQKKEGSSLKKFLNKKL